ncbi:unnamed protein product [Rotaria sp. Silwood2]|nr:unnamed protein product [Rotaria sp. Silwood2]
MLEPTSMERILLVTSYPNLTELKISNFQRDNSLCYLADCELKVGSLIRYSKTVYAHILAYFENLKHLSIVGVARYAYPGLCLHDLPSNTFSSSILTYLCINVGNFTGYLLLLDGRLKKLIDLMNN